MIYHNKVSYTLCLHCFTDTINIRSAMILIKIINSVIYSIIHNDNNLFNVICTKTMYFQLVILIPFFK